MVESPADTIMNDEALLLSQLVTAIWRNAFQVKITKYLSYFPNINQLFGPKLQLHKYPGWQRITPLYQASLSLPREWSKHIVSGDK
jgi:hypothetical protein